MADRLKSGICLRLCRYTRVLAQAQSQGRKRITSEELSRYTNISATRIRHDLSRFGRFGEHGLGYPTDYLLAKIRAILGIEGRHPIALVGAGRLSQAIAESAGLAEHGFEITAVFDVDPSRVGQAVGRREVTQLRELIRERNLVIAVIAVPATRAQEVADELIAAGVKIILNYSEGLLRVPPGCRCERRTPQGYCSRHSPLSSPDGRSSHSRAYPAALPQSVTRAALPRSDSELSCYPRRTPPSEESS